MKPTTIALVMALCVAMRITQAGAIAQEKPPADPATDKAVSTEAVAKKPKEFKPPPGFVAKKRGKYILYCKKDTPMGTRIKSEICYDEVGMRNYMLALQETKGEVDRVRAICSNPCACGQPEAC